MLAAVAAVAALGVLRDVGTPTQLFKVAVAAGLDAGIPAAPQEPSADRAQRCRQAVGAEKPQSSVRTGRADVDLSRRARHPDTSTCRDDHGLDVLAGAAHC